MSAIFKREFKSYFTSPIGYTVLAIFFLISGFFFSVLFAGGSPDLTGLFSTMFLIVLVVIPILTMRIFTDDKRNKTEQLLFTAPVKLSGVVMGKFFAAFAVFAIAIGITIVYQLLIAAFITPDWMVYLGNLLGILLLGGTLIAMGMFVSSLTESPVVAAICSFFLSLFVYIMDSLASLTGVSFIEKLVGWVSFNERYRQFTVGIFDYDNVIFFVSIIGLFLFFTVRILDRKRYA